MVHWVLPNNLLDQRWLLLPLLIEGVNDYTLLVLDATCRVVLSSKKKGGERTKLVREKKNIDLHAEGLSV